MRLTIHLSPRSAQNKITPQPDGSYKIKITAPPVDGAANAALIELLSREFKIAKSKIKIIRGSKSKNKIVEIV